MFDSTIRANLLLAKPGATEAELDLALRRAHLRDWVGPCRTGSRRLWGRTGASCRAASGSASRLPARSSPTRPFSSSTSRPRTSTRRPPARLSKTPSNHPEVARSRSSPTVPRGSTASRNRRARLTRGEAAALNSLFFSLTSWALALILLAIVGRHGRGRAVGHYLRKHHETLREPLGVLQAALARCRRPDPRVRPVARSRPLPGPPGCDGHRGERDRNDVPPCPVDRRTGSDPLARLLRRYTDLAMHLSRRYRTAPGCDARPPREDVAAATALAPGGPGARRRAGRSRCPAVRGQPQLDDRRADRRASRRSTTACPARCWRSR